MNWTSFITFMEYLPRNWIMFSHSQSKIVDIDEFAEFAVFFLCFLFIWCTKSRRNSEKCSVSNGSHAHVGIISNYYWYMTCTAGTILVKATIATHMETASVLLTEGLSTLEWESSRDRCSFDVVFKCHVSFHFGHPASSHPPHPTL